MGKKLIIVESPTKIKTLRKFLGEDFIFASSMGHIRDLPARDFGIDVDNGFEPRYTLLADKKETIEQLKKASQKADVVLLSPDPDREGEAIAWHIAQVLPASLPVRRVTFSSITKQAVVAALQHPRDLDRHLFEAQQARRLLDRIVGYKISPILMRRVQRAQEGGLSAGRVQSVALKMVVDREKEIEAFVAVEYWNLSATLRGGADEPTFSAALQAIDGKRVVKEGKDNDKTITIATRQQADALLSKLKSASYTVDAVSEKEKKRYPVPPFITSTLQQEASRHHRFSAARTMQIAQSLYEGVDLGKEGSAGLITYMRTDSVRVVPEMVQAARDYIATTYGRQYLPATAVDHRSKQGAQDAHEAIRPTDLQRTPDQVNSFLSPEQQQLYALIWKRFLSSQMRPAVYDTASVDIATDCGLSLRASGSRLKFAGFLLLYEEKQDEERVSEPPLPPLRLHQPLTLVAAAAQQAFTRPPPRFSEAALIKQLEQSGVGRPSTYAAIMSKIQSRDYTWRRKGLLQPTELGRIIAQMLEEHFQMIMNIGFTRRMEDALELVAQNKKGWRDLLQEFWQEFQPAVATAEENARVPKILTEKRCPQCNALLHKIWAKRKYFYGCSRYPECSYTASLQALSFDKGDYAADFDWEQLCPKCGHKMRICLGSFSPFLGCTQYPTCKGAVPIPGKGDQQELPACPAIGCCGRLMPRHSRFGKRFFSCSQFPDCDVSVARLEQLAEKYHQHPQTPYRAAKKSSTGRKKRTGRGQPNGT